MQLSDYQTLSHQLIGCPFKQPQLLRTAFTHRSYLNEHRRSTSSHNERLEFLGDAVLELVVTEHLYKNYQEAEGVLTNWRASLVRTETIGQAATRLGFNDYLRLSHGEQQGSQRARQQILANSFEAVIGAIYLDQGYQVAATFIDKNILSNFQHILQNNLWLDAKTQLQELIQSNQGATPVYRVLKEAGPDHDKSFVIGVYVNEQLLGTGSGPSKQLAQKAAAEQALAKNKS